MKNASIILKSYKKVERHFFSQLLTLKNCWKHHSLDIVIAAKRLNSIDAALRLFRRYISLPPNEKVVSKKPLAKCTMISVDIDKFVSSWVQSTNKQSGKAIKPYLDSPRETLKSSNFVYINLSLQFLKKL
jgi:hypothetical protein